jgi:hypothetical protein
VHYLVVGHGKAGTTALFTCLEQSCPANTYVNFEPRSPEEIAAVFDVKDVAHTLSKVKLQYLNDRAIDVSRFDKVVLIVRDPRDLLVSRLLYGFSAFERNGLLDEYEEALALLQRKVDDPDSIGVYELLHAVYALGREPVATHAQAQRASVRFARRHAPFIIKYEDFVDRRLEALEAWLELPLVRDIDVGDRRRRVERTKSYGEWPEWFTDEDLRRVNAEWKRFFAFFGYTPVWQSKAAKSIREDTSIEYVRQFRPTA